MSEDSNDLAALRRWEAGGANWRVLGRSAAGLDIALLTCDAGEQVGRLTSTEPDVLSYVGDRNSNEDETPPATG
jgi:hypothetical protein